MLCVLTQNLATMVGWELRLGLEIHAQLRAPKLFSNVMSTFKAAPNSNVCLLDAAVPGTLPTLRTECVAQAIRAALALNGTINRASKFVRKHYFYADLPLGYQITQVSDVDMLPYLCAVKVGLSLCSFWNVSGGSV
jgi:Asp-tRNA(Asn)/Glu-tRNA(Gln) amidotransferase B subunit